MSSSTDASGMSTDRRTAGCDEPARRPFGRVLIVEEHALVATGLRLALTEHGWDVEASSSLTTHDTVEHAQRFEPHCVLLGTTLRPGGPDVGDLIAPLVATGAQVVMVTGERRRAVLGRYLEAGAAGWIGVQSELGDVHAALEMVISGQSIVGKTRRFELLEQLRVERERVLRARATFDRLTPREALVLVSLSEGLSAEDIAEQHFVALTTVRSQIRGILQKLGVNSQLAAVAIADAHRDLLPVDPVAERNRRRVDPPARVS
jgi:DNA-binding NarL/FixJ family response regulator